MYYGAYEPRDTVKTIAFTIGIAFLAGVLFCLIVSP